MKIKIKSKVQEEKNFNYILHTLKVTQANILDWIKLESLFESPDFDTGKFERYLNELDLYSNGVSFVNVKENSFDIEIGDYYDKLSNLIPEFLTKNSLQYEMEI